MPQRITQAGLLWSIPYMGSERSFVDALERQMYTTPSGLSVEKIDVLRHREITSKAISAILISLLRWFKVSRECPILSSCNLA